MSKTHFGDAPVNSRIFIEFAKDGKKHENPIVNFGYPEKEEQISGFWKVNAIAIFSLPIALFMLFGVIILSQYLNPLEYPETCYFWNANSTVSNLTNSNSTSTIYLDHPSFIILECSFKTYANRTFLIEFRKYNLDTRGTFYMSELHGTEIYLFGLKAIAKLIIYAILTFLFYVIVSKLIAKIAIKTKMGQRVYPSLQKKMHDKKWSAEFTSCPKNKIIELPLFSNIYMDFEATDDFSDYLESMEIREHDFSQLVKKGYGKKRRIEKKPNVYLWKAIFKFSSRPKKGRLQIFWT